MLTKQLCLPTRPQPLPPPTIVLHPLFSPSHLGRLPLSRALLHPAKTVNITTTRGDRPLLSTVLPTRSAIVVLLHPVRPAASATTNRAALPACTTCKLESQVDRLKNQGAPQKSHKAYQATPTELPDGDSREYALHARTRLLDSSVWCDDDNRLQGSGPVVLPHSPFASTPTTTLPSTTSPAEVSTTKKPSDPLGSGGGFSPPTSRTKTLFWITGVIWNAPESIPRRC